MPFWKFAAATEVLATAVDAVSRVPATMLPPTAAMLEGDQEGVTPPRSVCVIGAAVAATFCCASTASWVSRSQGGGCGR